MAMIVEGIKPYEVEFDYNDGEISDWYAHVIAPTVGTGLLLCS